MVREVDKVVRDGGRVGVQMSSEMRNKSDSWFGEFLCIEWYWWLFLILLEIHTYLHILYICYCSVTKLCPTLCDPMDCRPPDSSVVFPRQNTGVSCHFLLQGIFLDPVSNPFLPQWQEYSLPLNHQGSPYIVYKTFNIDFVQRIVKYEPSWSFCGAWKSKR